MLRMRAWRCCLGPRPAEMMLMMLAWLCTPWANDAFDAGAALCCLGPRPEQMLLMMLVLRSGARPKL